MNYKLRFSHPVGRTQARSQTEGGPLDSASTVLKPTAPLPWVPKSFSALQEEENVPNTGRCGFLLNLVVELDCKGPGAFCT